MSKLFTSLFITLICLGVVPALCAQNATFTLLPMNGALEDMTDDAQMFVGEDWNVGELMRYHADGTVEHIGGEGMPKCSGDGNGICAGITDGGYSQAALWLGGKNWQALGGIGGTSGTSMSTAYDISDDGSFVVGLGWVNAGTAHAFIWDTVNGMVDLGSLGGGSSRANAVNRDGSVVVGWDADTTGWWRAARWVNGVEEIMAPGTYAGDCQGVSSDGTWIVGNNHPANIDAGYLYSDATGFIDVGTLSGWQYQGHPIDVSDDGKVVVGWSGYFMDQFATIWTEETGLKLLSEYLLDLGVILPPGLNLTIAHSISSDGTTIVGWAKDVNWNTNGFIVTIPPVGGGTVTMTASDDFNRPNSSSMGPDWVEMEGNTDIENNMGKGNTGAWSLGWMYHSSFEADYVNSVQSIDFIANQGSENVFLVAGLDPNTWGGVSVKIQDNDMDGIFDRVFFESAINAGNWGTLGVPVWYDLATKTGTGTMTVYFEDNGDTAVCEIQNDASGATEIFKADGILTFPYPITGKNFGIGHYHFPYFDNWNVEADPNPLFADTSTLSARSGGVVNFTLNAGVDQANRDYFLLGTSSGTMPGTQLAPGVVLPLNWDVVTDTIIGLANGPMAMGFSGTLDDGGMGSATLDTLGYLPSDTAGITLNFAYVLYYPTDYVSNPVVVHITP